MFLQACHRSAACLDLHTAKPNKIFMLRESLPDPGKGLRCLPGTLLGPVSESVVACVSDQAGGEVGSAGDSSLLKGVEQLCSHTKASQNSTRAASCSWCHALS